MINEIEKKEKYQNSLFRKTLLMCWVKSNCPLNSKKAKWFKVIEINKALGLSGTQLKEYNCFYRSAQYGKMRCKRNDDENPSKKNVMFKLTRDGINYIIHYKLYDYITLPNVTIDVTGIEENIRKSQELGLRVPY